MYQVDVFTNEYYKGNPAAVCILKDKLEDSTMKLIAAEMNLSETAFVLPIDEKSNRYLLRWFTPEVEVSLCGHGTIGTAKVLYEVLNIDADIITFETKSGDLIAKRYSDGIGIDMPLDIPEDIIIPKELIDAIGIKEYEDVKIGKKTRKLIIRVNAEDKILNLKPDFNKMKSIEFNDDIKGVAITTDNTDDYDFISRYFNPWAGINEDPVTGSVHTVLVNYWGSILGKNSMRAYQASYRAGELILKIQGDRVEIVGDAIISLKGEIYAND
jgi:PhzF family phenazine biosynthesis protein